MSSVSSEGTTVINATAADFVTVNDNGAIGWFVAVDREEDVVAPITPDGDPIAGDDLEWPLESTVEDLRDNGIEVVEHPSVEGDRRGK